MTYQMFHGKYLLQKQRPSFAPNAMKNCIPSKLKNPEHKQHMSGVKIMNTMWITHGNPSDKTPLVGRFSNDMVW